MNKKNITIIGIILVILILLLGMFIYVNNSNKELSKEDYISLMKKFDKIKNVKMEGKFYTFYKKDERSITDYRSSTAGYTWSDGNEKKVIRYIPENMIYSISEYNDPNEIGLENCDYKFFRI